MQNTPGRLGTAEGWWLSGRCYLVCFELPAVELGDPLQAGRDELRAAGDLLLVGRVVQQVERVGVDRDCPAPAVVHVVPLGLNVAERKSPGSGARRVQGHQLLVQLRARRGLEVADKGRVGRELRRVGPQRLDAAQVALDGVVQGRDRQPREVVVVGHGEPLQRVMPRQLGSTPRGPGDRGEKRLVRCGSAVGNMGMRW
jgi:hypothetical protein